MMDQLGNCARGTGCHCAEACCAFESLQLGADVWPIPLKSLSLH